MTNEEIEMKAAWLADNLNISDERDYLTRMIRTLVAQAYEEAAQLADTHSVRDKECESQWDCDDKIAADIRTLKGLLVEEIPA